MFSLFIREKVRPLSIRQAAAKLTRPKALHRRGLSGLPLRCRSRYAALSSASARSLTSLSGPNGANIFNPRHWANGNEDVVNEITLELTRVVLAIGVFAIGVGAFFRLIGNIRTIFRPGGRRRIPGPRQVTRCR